MNNNILPDNEVIDYESRLYVNPQTSLDEQNSFIDNLRNVQSANNAEINAQTYNLGTAVPSNLGGLVGGEGYWANRYQTPQTNAVAANLKSAAQYNALMESLQNQTNAWKQRYNNTYKAARRRAASYGGGSGDSGQLGVDTVTDMNIYGDYSPASNKGAGYLNIEDGVTYYVSEDGTKRYNLRDWDYTGLRDAFSDISEPLNKNKYKSGDVITGKNGVQYLYYPGEQSSGGGYYYPITSIEDI